MPKNGQDVVNQNFEGWGLEVSPEGISREQFVEGMEKNGWTKEGDREILRAMYRIGCHNQQFSTNDKKMDFFSSLMKMPAEKYDDREKALDFSMLTGNVSAVNAEERIELTSLINFIVSERNRQQDLAGLYNNGWSLAGDNKIIEIVDECEKEYGAKIDRNKKYDETDFVKLNVDIQTHIIEPAEKEGWFGDSPEKLEALKKTSEVLSAKADELSKKKMHDDYLFDSRFLRKYLKEMIDKGMDQIEQSDDVMKVNWGLDINVEAQKISKEKEEALKNGFAELEIDVKDIEEDEYELRSYLNEKYKEVAKEKLNDLVDEDTAEMDFDFDISTEDLDKIKNDPEKIKQTMFDSMVNTLNNGYLTDLELSKQVEKHLEENEDVETRRNNIESTKTTFLEPMLKLLQDPRNAEFVKAVKEKGDTESVELIYNPADRFIKKILSDSEKSAESDIEKLAIIEKLSKMQLKNTNDILSKDAVKDTFWNDYAPSITEKDIEEMQKKYDALVAKIKRSVTFDDIKKIAPLSKKGKK